MGYVIILENLEKEVTKMSNYNLRLHKPLGKQDLTIYTRAIYIASAYVHRMWNEYPGYCLDQEELDESLATLTTEFKIWHLRRLVYKLTGDKWRTLDEIMCQLGYYIWNTLPVTARYGDLNYITNTRAHVEI